MTESVPDEHRHSYSRCFNCGFERPFTNSVHFGPCPHCGSKDLMTKKKKVLFLTKDQIHVLEKLLNGEDMEVEWEEKAIDSLKEIFFCDKDGEENGQ